MTAADLSRPAASGATASPAPASPPPRADLRTAFERLQAASRRSVPTYDERIAALDKLGRALARRHADVARAVSADFGHRSSHETWLGDVLPVVAAIAHTKAHLRDWMEPEERETSWLQVPSTAQVIAQPLGVVGIISAWNYPVQLALSPLVSAVSAGNRALVKPSELSARLGELLVEIVAEAFDPDWVAVVTGGPEVGEAFASLPFDHLVFTGSGRVGKLVMRAASENLVPVTLELGGKSPAIIGPDFDVKTAADRILLGKTFNAGQTCIAPDYVLVPTAKRNAFVEGARAAVARLYPTATLADNPDYTAIASDAHYARLREIVDDARRQGAEVIALGPTGDDLEKQRKIAPTLILDATDAMLCMREEIFGPVLPVVGHGGLDEAIAFVNARPRPLALYYFGHRSSDVDRVLAETVSGGVAVNETLLQIMQNDLPHGGVGQSGMGKYHGREGFEALSHLKPVYRQSRIRTRGLLAPPFGKAADKLLRLLLGA